MVPPACTGAEAPGWLVPAGRSTIVSPQLLSVAASQQNRAIDAVSVNPLPGSRWVQSLVPLTTPGPLMSVVPKPDPSGCWSRFGYPGHTAPVARSTHVADVTGLWWKNAKTFEPTRIGTWPSPPVPWLIGGSGLGNVCDRDSPSSAPSPAA